VNLAFDTPTGLTIDPGRNTAGPIVPVVNTTAYGHYRIYFRNVREPITADSMQVAEIELLAIPEPGSIAVLVPLAALATRRRRDRA
jgi:hypothetical protein